MLSVFVFLAPDVPAVYLQSEGLVVSGHFNIAGTPLVDLNFLLLSL